MKIRALIALAALLFVSGIVVAHERGDVTPRVDRRQARQERRIEAGVENGQLTAAELARLEAQQARIERHEARVKADGEVTGRERASLHIHQDKASTDIARKKLNRRQAGDDR